MNFEVRKTEWMGFGQGTWPDMHIDDDVIVPVKEIRILGY